MTVHARFARCFTLICGLGLFSTVALGADTPTPVGPNSDPTYQQLRNLGLGGEAVTVTNVELKRDAATFHLRSGTVCFVAPVNGKVTGAVFMGDGTLVLNPPLEGENRSLKLLTKEDEFVENYSQLVLRFTDSTYDELKKAGNPVSGGCDAGLLRDSQTAMRHNLMLKYNLDGRILEDVLSPEPGGLFLAFVHGKKYSSKQIFAIDPHGAPPLIMSLSPEEVELITYDENKIGVWAAFHYSSEYKNGTASGAQKNSTIHIEHQQLNTIIEKSATLIGKATTTFVSQVNGLRVVPFDLFPTLRVQSVTGEGGQPLSFIQEDKNDDADFSVILPKTLAAGEKYTVVTTYGGKDAVRNEGGGNYYPVSRNNWYPNNVSGRLGEYTAYDMIFGIPKGMKIAVTGSLVSESNDGGQNVTVWKSEVPQTVAGFNIGRFKVEEVKLTKPEYVVESWANEEPPDWVRNLQRAVSGDNNLSMNRSHMSGVALGTMNTTSMMKKPLAEAQVAVQLYSDYFGAIPYKRLAVTQQTACNYGQAWPTLVWLPICSFFDETVQHTLGLDWGSRGYWKSVTAHEVAHQWWGHQVGFSSYRDQWMSEGFAELSASIFIQLIEKNPKKFIEFWNDEREMIVERNKEGYRPIDVGPITMGYRLRNSRVGFDVTRHLIYPKGGYILHMIRMMMWGRQTGDQNFKETMQDFAKTYGGRAATTEDFKAMVEKHMTPEMAAVGNGKMDWFFDEYVYGTALPSYSLDYATFDADANGEMVFAFKLTQSGVDQNFRMLVPLYIELADGRIVPLGRVRLTGNSSAEQKVSLKGLKDKPRRALVNYNDDVLASN